MKAHGAQLCVLPVNSLNPTMLAVTLQQNKPLVNIQKQLVYYYSLEVELQCVKCFIGNVIINLVYWFFVNNCASVNLSF